MVEKLMKLPLDELQELFEENLREAEGKIVQFQTEGQDD